MNRLLLEHEKSYDKNLYICRCYKNDHDALMSVFYFIDTSTSKHVDIFIVIGFRLRTSEVYAWGVDMSILHHAFIFIFIALWAVITRYVTILMAILSYFTRFTMKRGNAGSWNSGLGKEQILETYSAQLQKS